MLKKSLPQPGMTNEVDINRPMTVGLILWIITIGYAFLLMLPGLVGGMVDHLKLTIKQAGFVASAQMFGMMLGAFWATFTVNRVNFRKSILIAIWIVLAADIISALIKTSLMLAFIRVVAGIGVGIITGNVASVISRMRYPDRVFALLFCAQFVFGAIGLFILPYIFQTAGMSGAFLFLAGLSLSVLAVISRLPRVGYTSDTIVNRKVNTLPKLHAFLALSSLLIFYTSNGALWAYIDRIGVLESISVETVGMYLGISMLAGVLGGVLAFLIGAKFGRAIPVCIGFVGMIVGIVILSGSFIPLEYFVAASLINCALSFSVAYFLGFCAFLDPMGRIVVIANLIIITGLSLGPILGGVFITDAGFGNLLRMLIVWLVICFLMIEAAILTY